MIHTKFLKQLLGMSAALLLAGCSTLSGSTDWTAEKVAALFAGDFSTDTQMSLGELEMTGELHQTDGVLTLGLLTPEHLEGLSFAMTGEDMTVSYKGLSIQGDSVPVPGLGSSVAMVLDVLVDPAQLTLSDETPIQVSGDTENGRFVLTMGEDGPTTLEIPALEFNCQFTQFSATSQAETVSSSEALESSEETSSEASSDVSATAEPAQ